MKVHFKIYVSLLTGTTKLTNHMHYIRHFIGVQVAPGFIKPGKLSISSIEESIGCTRKFILLFYNYNY